MAELKLNTIGTISCNEGDMRIVLDKNYAPALTGLEDISHIQVLWWFCVSPVTQEFSRMAVRMRASSSLFPKGFVT